MAHQTDLGPESLKGLPRDPRISDATQRREFLAAIASGELIVSALPSAVVLAALAAEAVSRPKPGRPRKKKAAAKPAQPAYEVGSGEPIE